MENLNDALILLVAGMGTVFFILLFIIYFSKFMIFIINKYVPEEKLGTVRRTAATTAEIPSKVVAAITTAINTASQGKMKVTKIEKEN